MDLTLFLFDTRQQLRKVITQGIVQCTHGERDHTLAAEIPIRHEARPGEFLGLRCVDGRFRMFCIEYADDDDTTGTCSIMAKDAAVDELIGTIISRAEHESIAASAAVSEIAAAVGYAIGVNEAGSETARAKGGIMSAWDALQDAEGAYSLFMAPYYIFDGARITGRVLDVLAKKPVYRGRFVQRGHDAESIAITRASRPKPKIYPIGADGLTIADVVWSTANGDPVDKPAGQMWIGVPEAVDKYLGRGQTYELTDVTDAGELARKAWTKAQEAAKPSVSATATISDMEMVAGQTWKSVRLWDLVRVRPKHGEDVEEQIIDIERNYVHPELTEITLGKESESSAKQVKSLIKSSIDTARSVSSYGRSIAETKDELYDQYVKVEELDTYTKTTFGEVYVKLNAQEAAILLAATKEELAESEDYYNRRYSEVSIRLDAAETNILLKASLTQVEGIEQEVSEAYILIDGLNSKLELKADLIVLDGYVTANQLQTEFAEFESSIADTLYVRALSCSGFSCSSISLNGYGFGAKRVTVLTSNTSLTVTSTGGTVTGVKLNKDTETIYYWSWE